MRLLIPILALAGAAGCRADSLTLRDGQVVHGTYMGGTARTVKMQVNDNVKTYDVTDIATLEFTAPAPEPPRDLKAKPHASSQAGTETRAAAEHI